MTSDEFQTYAASAIVNYAAEKKRGEDLSDEEAAQLAREDFARLLPEGERTPDQMLFTVVDPARGLAVGSLWLGVKKVGAKSRGYIYDIVLHEAQRGQGYGRKTMELLEQEFRKMGLREIALHVFGHNVAAQSLYEKMGYRTTNRLMAKTLLTGTP